MSVTAVVAGALGAATLAAMLSGCVGPSLRGVTLAPSTSCPVERGTVVKLGLAGGQLVSATVEVGQEFWADAGQGASGSNFPASSSPSIRAVCTRLSGRHSQTLFRAVSPGEADVTSVNTCVFCAKEAQLAEIHVLPTPAAS